MADLGAVSDADSRRRVLRRPALDDDAEALYDRAPCGYLSTAPDGTIVKVNGTFLTLDRLHGGASWSAAGASSTC